MGKFAIFYLLLSAPQLFSQSGTKWATSGNSISSGEFLGSTNNAAVLFRTNNVQRMSLSNTGVLQVNNLSGTGIGFATLDASGNLSRTNFGGDGASYLGNDGTFHSVVLAAGWTTVGANDLENVNTGNVGIGIAPGYGYKLDVNGNMNVNGTIFASGLMLANKVVADSLKGTTLTIGNNLNLVSTNAQHELFTNFGDLRVQCRTGFSGNMILVSGNNSNLGVGTDNPQYKLDVNGEMRVSGKIITGRIIPLPGDSEIHIGDSSIVWNSLVNRIFATPTTFNSTSIKGITLDWGYASYARGSTSVAIGTNVATASNANAAIVIGSGPIPSTNPYLTNTIAN